MAKIKIKGSIKLSDGCRITVLNRDDDDFLALKCPGRPRQVLDRSITDLGIEARLRQATARWSSSNPAALKQAEEARRALLDLGPDEFGYSNQDDE